MNIILLYFVIKYEGNWDKVYNALDKKEKVSLQELNALEKRITDDKIKYISLLDLDYPKQLKEAYKPPFVLFYEGNCELLNENKFITYTGETSLGKDITAKHIHELETSYTLVTNTATDVDKEVHQNTSKGMLVIVNGKISDSPLQPTNKDLVVSEYLLTPKEVNSKVLLSSNRLLAAWSEKLIFTSSQETDMTKSQLSNFLNLGKEIDCFAHAGENFNSKLIQMGANLITDIKASNKSDALSKARQDAKKSFDEIKKTKSQEPKL